MNMYFECFKIVLIKVYFIEATMNLVRESEARSYITQCQNIVLLLEMHVSVEIVLRTLQKWVTMNCLIN